MSTLFKYIVSVTAVTLFVANIAHAQIVNEVFFAPPAATGDWGTATNWTDYGQGQNVPEGQFDERAILNIPGVATQVTTSFPAGTTGIVNGPGELVIQQGILEIQTTGLLGLSEPTAAPTVDRSATISDVLNIQGAGQLLNVSTISFGSNSTYDLDITASTTSPLEVQGVANLSGTLDLDFSALPDPVGTYTLMTAGSFSGGFSVINAASLSATQGVSVRSDAGVLTASVNNLPTLTIDRDLGTAVFENTNGAPISMDGFSIRSGLGGLDETQFTGLPRSGWLPSGANSSTAVADTYEGPDLVTTADSIPTSTPYQVGGAGFWSLPAPNEFLQETEDIIFEFTDPSLADGPLQGVVNFVGEKVVNNNIALTINSAGEAVMLNQSPYPQNVEVYRITSSGSPLQTDTWSPLEGQLGLDNSTWQISAQSDTEQLLEVTESGSSLFDSFTIYDIGQILDPGFSELGLTFEFLLEGDDSFTTGAIVFGDHPTVSTSPGDFNGDGTVDAADYTVWRDNLGSFEDGSTLAGNGTGGNVDSADYDLWVSTFGSTYGSSTALSQAVPEPTSALLMGLVIVGGACYSRTPRFLA